MSALPIQLSSVKEFSSKIHATLRKSNKQILRQACLLILEDPKALRREKLQAAAILEKLMRFNDLASRRKKKQKCVKVDTKSQIEGILGE